MKSRQSTGQIRRLMLAALLGLLSLSLTLAACGQDKGDPEAITRDFLISLWSGDSARVGELACSDADWRTAMIAQAQAADPGVTVDTEHLTVTIDVEAEQQVRVLVGGQVTFKSAEGQVEVRDLESMGQVAVMLVDEDGWKVCDLR